MLLAPCHTQPKGRARFTLLTLGAAAATLLAFGADSEPAVAADDPSTATDSSSVVVSEATSAAPAVLRQPLPTTGCRRLIYALDLETRHRTLDARAATKGDSAVRYRGDLVLDEIERSASRSVIAVTLQSLRVDAQRDGQPSAAADAIAGTAGKLAVVDLDAHGKILGYRFPAGFEQPQRSLLRTLVPAFTFTIPAGVADAWTAAEADSAGSYVAAYARESAPEGVVRIQRRKLRYTSFATTDTRPFVCEPTGEVRAELASGWPRQVDVAEAMTVGAEGDPVRYQGEMRGRISLRQVAVNDKPPLAPDGQLEPAGGELEDLTGCEREGLARVVGGATFEGLIEAIAAHAAAGDRSRAATNSWFQFACLLELRPELAPRVHELITGRGVPDAVAQALVAALGAAGRVEFQSTLVAVYDGADLSDDVRHAAAVAMAQLRRPTGALLEAVLGRLQDAPRLDGLSATGMLAFGAAASRNRAVLGDGRTPTQALLALEPKAAESGTLAVWLEALGNADPQQAVPRVLQSVRDASERVRQSAASALRHARDEHSLAALDDLARTDPSPSVRQMAVSSLSNRTAAANTLRKVAREDAEEAVRREAIVALGQCDGTATRSCLQAIATSDSSQDLRQLAAGMLGR